MRFEYLDYLRWAARHADQLPRLIGLARHAYEAIDDGPVIFWENLKALGDAVAPLAESLLDVGASHDDVQIAAVHTQALLPGSDLAILWQMLQLVLPALLEYLGSRRAA